MKKKSKILSAVLLVIVCVATICTTAFAGNSYSGFNHDVPKFNDAVETSRQTKAVTSRSGQIIFDYVGGGYKVDCRMVDQEDNRGAWVYNLVSGSDELLPSRASHTAGEKVHVYISSKLTTPVDVHVYGDWRSDYR